MAVNVDEAEKEFSNLAEEIRHETNAHVDAEKGEPVVLQDFFEDSVRTSLGPGGKFKKMGVVIKNLTVVGIGADAVNIPSNLDLFHAMWPPNWFNKSKGTPFNILNEITAYCKDGEMLLVLGRPGAGCSSLLRVIANERDSFASVTGDVSYGGISASDFGPYAGEAIYAPEEDAHFPSLTLKETLTFALRTKTPGKRFPGQTKQNFRQIVFKSLMKMFGLEPQIRTQVGNEYIRGLSGGERKRLTICEAMVSRGAIECWDGSTRGLDAASALDYARSMRVLTDTLHKTTIASFYQASEAIYALFDKVLVLDKGRLVYFGSTKEAKQYFYELGFDCEARKSTPDYLTGISNIQERIIRPGFEDTAPQTSAELERAFQQSESFKRMKQEIVEYEEEIRNEQPAREFREAVNDAKAKRARKKSVFSSSLWEQFTALLARQAAITWGDKFELFARYFSIIIQALLYGSVFYNMPNNAVGGFARTGALFGSLVDTAMISQGEVIKTFIGRRILQKQQSYAMFHPALYYLCQVVLDIPVMVFQGIIFSLITYFMFGLDTDAGKFFTYVCILILTGLCITSLYRLLGNLSPSQYLTEQVANFFFIMMFLYSGFAPVRPKMKPWFSWIFWINPFAYAFTSLVSNEMKGVDYECLSGGYVPYGANYTDPVHRVCSLPGATPGETFVNGKVYTDAYLGFDIDLLGIYIMALLLLWLLFCFLNAMAIEFITWQKGGYLQKMYKKGKAPKQNDDNTELENAKAVAEATANMKPFEIKAGVFLWNDIKYTVKTSDGPRVLLDNVRGWIKPGQMTALMGSSGAGKTTLLDVLAQRKTLGVVEGTMLLDGKSLQKDFERITGYVEQMDVHDPLLTVREALRFSATLRQEESVSIEEKHAYVEEVLNMMEMRNLGDALIGDLETGVGISVEERRRLSIGMELVAKPQILFLDEPTSGLDAQSSYNIIKFVRKLADSGMPLVCTIHQPSSILFSFFDRLILLGKGGKLVYFDEIGPNASKMLGYFEREGVRPCTADENPAEYILEAIRPTGSQDWSQTWKASPENEFVQQELQQLVGKESQFGRSDEQAKEFAASLWTQMRVVYARFNTTYWRNPSYMVGRVLQSLITGLTVGFSFWKIGNSSSDVNLYVLAIVHIIMLGLTLIFAAMPQFCRMKELFKRDYASKYYSSMPFSVSAIVVEIPYLVIAATLCFLCVYWSCNFNTGGDTEAFYFWLIFVVFIIYCHTFGVAVAAASPHIGVAFLALPLIVGYLFLVCGVLNPPSNMPKFYSSWLYHLNPFRYFMEGIIGNALGPLSIECSTEDFLKFSAPAGLTCGEYTAEFMQTAHGYLDNPEASGDSLCNYCQYENGNEFLETLDWSIGNRWRNLGILIAYTLVNIAGVVGFTHLWRKQSR